MASHVDLPSEAANLARAGRSCTRGTFGGLLLRDHSASADQNELEEAGVQRGDAVLVKLHYIDKPTNNNLYGGAMNVPPTNPPGSECGGEHLVKCCKRRLQ